MGELPRQVIKYWTVVLVDFSLAYNSIFGRSLLVEFGAITSIWHLCMKFPTEFDIGTIRGDQKDARQTYMVCLRNLVMMVESLEKEIASASEPEELDPRDTKRGAYFLL